MNASYLTEDELMMAHTLPSESPYVIRYVTQTQFSIARHYGGITFNGHIYTYFPATDELIRDDVLKMVTKNRKKATKNQEPGKQAENIEQKELL